MDVATASHDSNRNQTFRESRFRIKRDLFESWLRVRQPNFRKVHEKSGLSSFELFEWLQTTTPTQEMTMVR